MGLIARLGEAYKSLRGIEGSNRGPFMGMGELGGWYRIEPNSDGWQRNLVAPSGDVRKVAIVYACVMAQARAVSACYAQHKRIGKDGSQTVQRDTWAARLLRNPNDYETWPQFILNVVCELMFNGESLVYMREDARYVPTSMHRIGAGNWQPYIEPETGAIFYGVSKSGNPCIPGELDYLVPARDVIHFRQHTPRNPLMGETPVTAAALAVGINVALSKSQAQFFAQMRRPSGVLSTDVVLNAAQIKQLRQAFDEQAKGLDEGGVPILAGGLKFSPMAISSQDAQLIEAQRMSIEDVCRVYGVPPPIVGDLSHATMTNAETLVNHWLAVGLGSLLENLESSISKAWGFGPDDFIELDTSALLRTDFKTRIEGLARGVQGGVYAINEARNREGLGNVEFGDKPLVQQQMVSLEYAASQKAPAAQPSPAPAADQPNPDDPNANPDNPAPPEKAFDPVIARALVLETLHRKGASA